MKWLIAVTLALEACGSSPPPNKTPPPPPPIDAPADPLAGIVQECKDYISAMERFAACPQLPPDSVSAVKESLFAFKRDVTNYATPDEARDACKTGADAIRQGMIQLGC